ncbi:transglutaminase family protein [Kribbella qitaiheensis]|uniref:transglutaminase-like domain-containing protein n=1 Tax=Kribbella qitaiheensis TaxID=1544730 RepID=UPI0036238A38
MEEYLAEDEVIDVSHPAITALAARLRRDNPGTTDFARAAFDFTRDEVNHSMDAGDPRVTVKASEVLEHRTGLCFAKSHLLTALLRAEGVPAGLCYQRLSNGKGGHFLHGMVAVNLDGTWYRQDPRGDKPGVTSEFSLDEERLAYQPDPALDEADLDEILTAPDPGVVAALRGADNVVDLVRNDGLPANLA